jgi:hypothetical protein
MHPCPECGQPVPRRGRRTAHLAFNVLCVRDQLAQYAPTYEELPELCGQGEDIARHLHLAAHEGASTAPVWKRRAKGWLRDATDRLEGLSLKEEVPATWQPIPRRAAAADGLSEQASDSASALIPA